MDGIKIGFDARPLNRDHVRGMGRYLLDMLAASDAFGETRWVAFSDRPDLPFHRPAVANFEVDRFDARGYRFRAWEQYALPRRARVSNVDVLHCAATTAPWWQPVPTVVTIHDTVPWTGEASGDPRWYLEGVLPRAYRKCAAVITISENSRRDIVTLWPELESKIHVIPHGIDEGLFADVGDTLPAELAALGVRKPYFLYVGGTIPRKRLDWAVEVHRRLSHPAVRLVIIGVGKDERAQVVQRIEPAFRSRVHVLPYVSEAAMRALYRGAVAVLYPTLYEGFGFPAVEAQAAGTPVLFSRVGSLAELEGPAAVILPTDDLGAWVQACERLLRERESHVSQNEQARKWASKFSWSMSARKHFDVFELARRQRYGGGRQGNTCSGVRVFARKFAS